MSDDHPKDWIGSWRHFVYALIAIGVCTLLFLAMMEVVDHPKKYPALINNAATICFFIFAILFIIIASPLGHVLHAVLYVINHQAADKHKKPASDSPHTGVSSKNTSHSNPTGQ